MVQEKHLASHRDEYSKSQLDISDLPENPIEGVMSWVNLAMAEKVLEPTAMNLATVNSKNEPSIRTVLLKDLVEESFVFYTNYESEKGANIKNNNKVSLQFFWPELQKQIRIKGTATKTQASLSDAYFNMRPRESRIGAVVSPQSKKITSRESILDKFNELNKQENIIRPENWGGYMIKPFYIEFWQGRLNRIHDRIVFEKKGSDWQKYRIAP